MCAAPDYSYAHGVAETLHVWKKLTRVCAEWLDGRCISNTVVDTMAVIASKSKA